MHLYSTDVAVLCIVVLSSPQLCCGNNGNAREVVKEPEKLIEDVNKVRT
jgi:hypothetical protein